MKEKPENLIADFPEWQYAQGTIRKLQKVPINKKTDVLLDVGMNVGVLAWAVAPKFKQVFGYEAHPKTYAKLRKNLKTFRLENVRAFRFAVSDVEGQTLYVSSPGNSTGASARPSMRLNNPPPDYYHAATTVDIKKVVAAYKPTHVKIDIEGGEYPVLARMGADWPAHVRHLFVEFHGTRSRQGWQKVKSCLKDLHAAGFKVVHGPMPLKFLPNGACTGLYFEMMFSRDAGIDIAKYIKGAP